MERNKKFIFPAQSFPLFLVLSGRVLFLLIKGILKRENNGRRRNIRMGEKTRGKGGGHPLNTNSPPSPSR
jgi:hypothetical protein